MSDPDETWLLNTRYIGRKVLHFSSLESTNDLALELAQDPRHEGTVILTDQQTKGRGQYGRVWQAPSGSSLLMSILLFPPPRLRRPVLLTALAAVAVSETIFQFAGLQTKIKWPNDLLLEGKKVSGILIECGSKGNASPYVVMGMGVNLNQSADDFSQLGLPDATSLAIATGKEQSLTPISRLLIHQLDLEYDRLLSESSDALESQWKTRLGLLGEEILVEFHDGRQVKGRLRELAFDGILLESSSGNLERIEPEVIRHLRGVPNWVAAVLL